LGFEKYNLFNLLAKNKECAFNIKTFSHIVFRDSLSCSADSMFKAELNKLLPQLVVL